MAHLTDLDLTAPADSLYSGGVVLNTWRTRIDVLNDALGDITSVEADQIEAIGTTTISAAQWAYLGALDQSIISTASVDFGEVDITKTTTLAAGGFGLRCQVTHSATGMTGTLRGAYIVATNAPFTATGTIRGAEIKSRAATSGNVGGNVTTLEGVSISCDAKNKTVTTQRGMEISLDGKSGAAVTTGVGIRIANNYQANIATTSYALQIYRDSFDYTADIQLSGGGLIGGSTGKIKMDASGVTTLTASGNLDIGSYNFRAASLTADGLTSGRVVFASTNGLLTDDSDFTFATDTLTVTKIAAFTLMGKLTAGAVEIEGSAFDINGGTIASVTLDGAIAGGDQAFTNVGDFTFANGSILAASATDTHTLLIKAGGLAGTSVITISSLDAGDRLSLANVYSFVASGNLDIGAHGFRANTLTADGLTATRVIFAGANGLLSDDADITFATDTLTVTKIGAFQAVGAIDFNTQAMTNVDINSGTINGITDLAVADGGTGSSTAANARTALGLVIGTNVLAQQTIGIADDNLVEIDHADNGGVADNDYAKFTANGLEGREASEILTDLGLDAGLANLTTAEVDQLEAIGDVTVSYAQWGYLGACGAGGGQLLAALTTGESTQLEAIGSATISAAQWGYLGACGAGGGQLLAALTTGESDQLELIGATTISAAQWGYLGGCSAILSNTVEDTTPQLGGELDCQAHTIGFTQQTATGDGTTTIDWRLGNKFYFTFGTQNDTFTFTAPTHECNLILVLKQDGTGSRTATWPATVKWPAATAPTLSTGANDVDIVCFYYDGTNYHGVSSLDFGVPA